MLHRGLRLPATVSTKCVAGTAWDCPPIFENRYFALLSTSTFLFAVSEPEVSESLALRGLKAVEKATHAAVAPPNLQGSGIFVSFEER